MKFLLLTLIAHHPDPVSGAKKSAADRLREVVDNAVLAEELGFDGFAVGERHEDPFISSSPPVVLSNIAAQAELFHVTTADQWDRNREGYELFRRLWDNERVTWSGRFRPPLVDAKALPRPLQPRIRIWHGSATSKDSVDLAARHGDPIFSANVTYPIEPYAELVHYYRERWAHYGHDPEDALVGAGTAGFHVAATTQQAVAEFRLTYESRLAFQRRAGLPMVFESIDDFVDRSSALVGSPQQVIDKVGRYHEQFGHQVIHLSAEADGVTVGQKRRSLELFQSDVAPVLRDQIASRPLAAQSGRKKVVL